MFSSENQLETRREPMLATLRALAQGQWDTQPEPAEAAARPSEQLPQVGGSQAAGGDHRRQVRGSQATGGEITDHR